MGVAPPFRDSFVDVAENTRFWLVDPRRGCSKYHRAAISDKHYTRIETSLYDLAPTIKVLWIVPLVDVILGENHA
jgi:hypothetical protein